MGCFKKVIGYCTVFLDLHFPLSEMLNSRIWRFGVFKNPCPRLLTILGVSPDLFFFQDRLSIIQLFVSVFREIQTLCLSYSKQTLHKQC